MRPFIITGLGSLALAVFGCKGSSPSKDIPQGGAGTAGTASPGKSLADRKNVLDDVNLVATFAFHAEGPNAPVDGTLTLKKISGEVYRGELKSGTKTLHTIGFRDGDLFSFAWSESHGVSAISMELFCDMTLEARLADDDANTAGKAFITGVNSSFSGSFTAEKGIHPGRDDTWSGRLDATASGDKVVTLAVTSADNGANKYVVIRHGDVLGGGFRYDKKPFAAAHLRINGGGATLEGQWVDSSDTAATPKLVRLTREGPPGVDVAVTPASSSKTATGIPCIDVPAGGHTLFPKRRPAGDQ